jgi:CheY-like chemotaxis protein
MTEDGGRRCWHNRALCPVSKEAWVPATILIVDDSPVIRQYLTIVLPRHGFEVRTATGGRKAIELYRRYQGEIALVLMDVQMPGLDGPQTLTALRGLNPGVRCCLMSADVGDYTHEQLFQLGALAFLEKPFSSPAALVRTLRECLRPGREELPLSA